MFVAVADTHTLIWYLYGSPRLSVVAKEKIEQAINNQQRIALSSISLAEMVYLVEKNRIPTDALQLLLKELNQAEQPSVFYEVAVSQPIILAMQKIPREQIPDLPDRIIAATSLHLKQPLISRDAKIRLSQVETIW